MFQVRRALSFLESRLHEGRVKRFTFFHEDATSCTVDIERDGHSSDTDKSWAAKPEFNDGDLD